MLTCLVSALVLACPACTSHPVTDDASGRQVATTVAGPASPPGAPTFPPRTAQTTPTSASSAPTPVSSPPTLPPQPELGSVVVLGDSMSVALAAPLRAALALDDCALEWHWCVGFLAPSSDEVWGEVLTERRPDVVVVFFAPWENEALRRGDVLDPADPSWSELYRRDFIEPWVELARSGRSHVVWVAMPRSRDAEISAQHGELNAIWADVVAAEPSMSWVDGAALLAPEGAFVDIDWTVDPPVRLINVDGVHICPPAAERLADAVLHALAAWFDVEVRSDWRTSGWESYPDAFGPGCPGPAPASV